MADKNTEFPVNTTRRDPYKNFRFKLKWADASGGKQAYIAGVSKVSGLKRTTEVVKHRSGGDPTSTRVSPGQSSYEAITLERGVTHDPEFEKWSNKVWDQTNVNAAKAGNYSSLKDFRKDITLELHNEAGQVVVSYNIFRCWVSEYEAMDALDSNANAVLIQTIKLENEGWIRDDSVKAPAEPSFSGAAS